MNKKIIIAVILLVAGFLFWQHLQLQKKARAVELLTAAYYGELLNVKNALDNGAPENSVIVFDDSARNYEKVEFGLPHAAASSGNEDLLNFLINRGTDMNQANGQGWTPLFLAVRDGHTEAAKLLIFRGVELNPQTDTGTTPLMLAVLPGVLPAESRLAFVTYFIKRGGNVNLKNQFGQNALYYAVTELKDPQIVAVMLENGADLKQTFQDGKTILDIAKETKGAEKIVPLLSKQLKNNSKK